MLLGWDFGDELENESALIRADDDDVARFEHRSAAGPVSTNPLATDPCSQNTAPVDEEKFTVFEANFKVLSRDEQPVVAFKEIQIVVRFGVTLAPVIAGKATFVRSAFSTYPERKTCNLYDGTLGSYLSFWC